MLQEKIQDPSLPSGAMSLSWFLIFNQALELVSNLVICLHLEKSDAEFKTRSPNFFPCDQMSFEIYSVKAQSS